jgi:2-keto-4-pentenoate hydratase/2-oxohepta-3-ene-1,7-dioic acid hydratase in catechol pathway
MITERVIGGSTASASVASAGFSARNARAKTQEAREWHPFTLSGTVMQDSTTERMTHTVYEMVSYVSHIVALGPGDIIATGSPAGVGAARNVFMKPGDTSV